LNKKSNKAPLKNLFRLLRKNKLLKRRLFPLPLQESSKKEKAWKNAFSKIKAFKKTRQNK
jgi:hypothetical protein